jgi:prepilin-type N-terminal cleavage/methylation domain-containing protein
MFSNRPRRRGFTLAEVLVTIAIIAIIAAAIIPAVTSQIGKGDETTVTAAVNTMRTSLTTFVADVRTFPSRLSQLTTVPTALTDTSLSGSAYSAVQVARWKGPYSTTSTFAADDSLSIGLNAFLGDSLKDSLNFVVANIHMNAGSAAANTALAFRIEALLESTPDSLNGTVRWRNINTSRRLKIFLTSSR